jgi:hypothetical protein
VAEQRVLTWDWKEQPDLAELGRAVAELSGGRVHLAEVDTQSDQFAIVLSTVPLDEQTAAELYERWRKGDGGG